MHIQYVSIRPPASLDCQQSAGCFLANYLWWEELHIISHHSPFTVSLSFTIALELLLLTPVILLPNSSQEPQSWPVDPGRKGQRDS